MKLIPVIDLMAGRAVWARPGERDSYAPLATSLCSDGNPTKLARLFAEEFGSDTLYVADLDAISGTGDNLQTVRSISSELPHLQLWTDAGLRDRESLEVFNRIWPGRPIMGSETLTDTDALQAATAYEAILSLDYRGTQLLGPPDLTEQPERWPRDLILMSLARVGSGQGPELDLLVRLRDLAPDRRLHAAGGVRGEADLQRLAEAGAAGVLLASALHDGRITPAVARRFA